MDNYLLLWSFFIYSFIGWCIEVAFAAIRYKKFVNRGFLNSSLCPIYGVGIVCVIKILGDYQDNLMLLYFMSVVVTTMIEWITGFCLEKLFHHKWWDYSNMPGNIQGYICPLFSLAWGIACVIIIRWFHPMVCKFIGWIPKIPGKLLLFFLLCLVIADICVTINTVMELNLRLKEMYEIAEELEKMSCYLGESISRNILVGLEKHEDRMERTEQMKKKYHELLTNLSNGDRRLLMAFPTIRSLRYGEQLHDLKRYLNRKKKQYKNEEDDDVSDSCCR